MYGYFLQPHDFFVPSPNEAVLKRICADFKGLPNGANFILIDHCVDEILSINKVSSERERTVKYTVAVCALARRPPKMSSRGPTKVSKC